MTLEPWTIAILGSTGFIGRALVTCLRRSASPVRVIQPTRHRRRVDAVHPLWSPQDEQLDALAFEGVDVVVNLAGEPIGPGRWTDAKKRRIHRSRVIGTELLAGALARCHRPPRVIVQASSVDYYGDRGDAWLDEESPRGDGFLARICELWERATEPARDAGIRVVNLRFGHVLGEGGLLASLKPSIRLGFIDRFGSGEQYWSWIAIDDLIAVLLSAISDPDMRGVYNAVSPEPVTNHALMSAYAEALGHRAFLPMPAAALRLALGRQQADEMLLSSRRVRPSRLLEHGVSFRHPRLDGALQAIVQHATPWPTEAVPATIPAP